MATHRFVIEGKEFHVEVGSRVGDTVQVTVNGKTYTATIVATEPGATPASLPRAKAAALPALKPVPVSSPPSPAGADNSEEVRAPMSGVVLSVAVAAGQAVTAGTNVLVLEAMKMENEIVAGVDGVVARVMVQAQQEVQQGDLLVTITTE